MSLDNDLSKPSAPTESPATGSPVVTDPRTLRALTHPVRLALLEALSLEGPRTATQVGEMIGESPTTCSFHLRQLAKYGFVEEAGGGKGRARPWRMTSIGMRFASSHDDRETEIATGMLVRLLRERQLERYRTWRETKPTFPRAWREAAGDSEYIFYLTADELNELKTEVADLLAPRFLERLTDPTTRPADALPVEMLVFAYPIQPPSGGGEGDA